AQLIGARTDFAVSLMHLGPEADGVALTSAYAAGRLSFTLGWGVELVNFRAGAGESSPFSHDVLLTRDGDDAQSALVTVGGAIVYKGYRIGAAGKYAADRLGANRHAMLLDVGVGHTLLGGLAGAAVQNLGPHDLAGTPPAPLPRQVALGWSRPQQAGPLDL